MSGPLAMTLDQADQDAPRSGGDGEHLITLEEALMWGQIAHRSGQLDVAEQLYRAVLEQRTDDIDALHFLGVLLHQNGESAAGEQLIRQALELAPDDPGPWNNLGNVLLESGQIDEATVAYRRCLELAPEFADALNNLGTIYRRRGDWDLAEASYLRAAAVQRGMGEAADDEGVVAFQGAFGAAQGDGESDGASDNARAADHLTAAAKPVLADTYNNLANLMMAQRRISEAVDYACKAITMRSGHASARRMLGLAYYRLGELNKAAAVYREWLAEEPDNPIAQHHLAACTGQFVPLRAADRYIEKTFDDFAASFDAKLEHLQYRAPQLIGEALEAACDQAAGALDVLDAGCGTGLCGPIVRAYARELTGVDLSAGMLQRARQRSVYDHVHKAELTDYLSSHRNQWDVVLSADTLCYFGDLADVLDAAYAALRPGGWLLFTVEAMADVPDVPYRLQPCGRYAHTDDYLAHELEQAGFDRVAISGQRLRDEGGEPVAGWLVRGYKAGPGGPARTERVPQ